MGYRLVIKVKIMKGILKILIVASVLLIVGVGVVAAGDMSDFQAPSDLEKGSGNYFENDDFELSINSYNKESDYDTLFKDDVDYSVTVMGDTAEYKDTLVDQVGVLEIVEIDGKYYVVECYFDGNDDSKLSECNDYLSEFNELNSLEPISID